ncbi:MAG: hypothetical protein NTAFB05_08550 [Nitrobacter sp.]
MQRFKDLPLRIVEVHARDFAFVNIVVMNLDIDANVSDSRKANHRKITGM